MLHNLLNTLRLLGARRRQHHDTEHRTRVMAKALERLGLEMELEQRLLMLATQERQRRHHIQRLIQKVLAYRAVLYAIHHRDMFVSQTMKQKGEQYGR